MGEKKTAPFGSWKSPITSDLIVSGSIGLGQIAIDGDDIYWIESRPSEKGRTVIIKYGSNGELREMTPPPYNARTRVHEYGGGSYIVHRGSVFFSNFTDQRIYRVEEGEEPVPVTREGDFRYADGVIDDRHNRILCVREDHSNHSLNPAVEAVNTIAGISLDGSGEVKILAEGCDFYSSPRLSPDGRYLAFLTWNHPNMPWDGSDLWVAEIDVAGDLKNIEHIAGGERESIFQPEWSPEGILYFVSDRNNWWNIYRRRDGRVEPVCEMEAEFGLPQWVFGMSTYAFESEDRIICTYTQNGFSHLAMLDTSTGTIDEIETEFSRIEGVCTRGKQIAFMAGCPADPTSIVSFNTGDRTIKKLRLSNELKIDPGYISVPQPVEFPTENGLTAHAFFYPAVNKDFKAPDGEKSPLLVMIHGGPTAAAAPVFRLGIQYWTSRGIAVLDVNYGGSTGYGRSYRERLKGEWGVVDVDDCVNGASYLVRQGLVDGDRLAITGGSAGGYTTLCALTFRNLFKAGASHYGVSDLAALEVDTHKFESRYTHSLVAPYPERADLYRERSPINHTDRLSAPVIFFQGLDDKVVPPNQAEMMVDALRAKKLPVAYVAFEGEQHGFRQAANIKRALDGEFYFYSRVFGFAPSENIEPVEIENL
ncbi:MAG: S9 family peptidase [Acidobacteria bacterium]|nr:S9 family peptidase [Acidobacteriota bacterium]